MVRLAAYYICLLSLILLFLGGAYDNKKYSIIGYILVVLTAIINLVYLLK